MKKEQLSTEKEYEPAYFVVYYFFSDVWILFLIPVTQRALDSDFNAGVKEIVFWTAERVGANVNFHG